MPADDNVESSNGEPSTEQPHVNDEAYVYAVECLIKGSKPAEVRKSLRVAGYTYTQVDDIVEYAINYRNQHAAGVGQRRSSPGFTIAIGAGLCVLGVVLTVIGFLTAKPGETFYVA